MQLENTSSKYVWVAEGDESMRLRMEGSQNKNHENHIAGRGTNSSRQYDLVHTFILMLEAMKIPDAQLAVRKAWENGEYTGTAADESEKQK